MFNIPKKIILILLFTIAFSGSVMAEESAKIAPPKNLIGGWTNSADKYMTVLNWEGDDSYYDNETGSNYSDYGYIISRNGQEIYVIDPSNAENQDVDYTDTNELSNGGMFFDTGISAGKEYKYSVVAFDHMGNKSDPAEITVKVYPDKEQTCSANPQLTLTTDGTNVSLEWPEMCGATGYDIKKRKLPDGETTVIASLISDNKYIDGQVDAGDYEYEVVGYQLISDTPADNLPSVTMLLGIKKALAATDQKKEIGRAKATITVVKKVATAAKDAAAAAGNSSLSTDFAQVFKKIYNFIISLAGVIFILLLLIGGIMYLTSAGNEESSVKAKKLLIDAIIGLVIVSIAYSAGKFVIKKLEGPDNVPVVFNQTNNLKSVTLTADNLRNNIC